MGRYMLQFVLPAERNRDDVLSFYDEIERSGGTCIGIGNYKSIDRWLTGMQDRHTGKICRTAMCAKFSTFAMKENA